MIGVCLRRAGIENRIVHDKRFLSWGFKPDLEKKFDVCEVDNIIYTHPYFPKELDCFWPKFLKARKR